MTNLAIMANFFMSQKKSQSCPICVSKDQLLEPPTVIFFTNLLMQPIQWWIQPIPGEGGGGGVGEGGEGRGERVGLGPLCQHNFWHNLST